jgi:transmembrane 9 superfamily member 3
MAGKNWIKAMILTASLFPFLCFSIGLVLNTIAIFYRSLAAIPFGTMVVIFVLWAFISFPLVSLGTVVGRNWSGAPNNPCRVKTIPRPIPEKKWYLTPSVISLMGGLLPFGSIFIEMYFVFTSFWNYKVNRSNIDECCTSWKYDLFQCLLARRSTFLVKEELLILIDNLIFCVYMEFHLV